MWSEDESSGLAAIVGPATLVAIGLIILFFLPIEALKILTVWTLVSFPIGVLIGHCALSEKEPG